MILSGKNKEELFLCLDKIGLKKSIKEKGSVLIKINLARPAEINHPRTDPKLLSDVIDYIYTNNGSCAISEGANGYLERNLKQAGLGDIIKNYGVKVIDLDYEVVDVVRVENEEHYLPRSLKDFGVRIAIPATSKRPNMIFSNNVKLFVGAVPRKMYQIGLPHVDWRPRIHIDLHKSVANLYRAIQEYSSFEFFINGGLAMDEHKGEFRFDEMLIGNDGVKLDLHVLNTYFNHIDIPEYLNNLNH